MATKMEVVTKGGEKFRLQARQGTSVATHGGLAHEFGDCLITVSTKHNLSLEQQDATGLIPRHAYAVLDVKQAGVLRMLKNKEPVDLQPVDGSI